MSTRSRIALRTNEQNYLSIYCHFDGGNDYPNSVGQQLIRYFTNADSVSALIALGSLSYIKEGQAHAYHRDMQEPWKHCCPVTSYSEKGLFELSRDCDAEYLYVFEDNQWTCYRL